MQSLIFTTIALPSATWLSRLLPLSQQTGLGRGPGRLYPHQLKNEGLQMQSLIFTTIALPSATWLSHRESQVGCRWNSIGAVVDGRFRRSSSDPALPGHLPPGEGFWGYLQLSHRESQVGCRWNSIGAVVDGRFRRSSSDPALPGHLPPGEGFWGYLHVSNQGTAKVNSRGRRGHAPALRKACSFCPNY